MARQYKLISGDGHVNEPPNLFIDHVPAKYRDRAPRLERFEQGDGWIMEGAPGPIPFSGLNAMPGVPPEELKDWMHWEDVQWMGGSDPVARITEQDMDRLDAEVMFPSPRIASGVFFNRSDPEFQIAVIGGYNDWLSEYCSHAPDRLLGLAEMPTVGIESALAELERAAKLPGMRGVFLGAWPNGSLEVTPEDDRFWARCQEMGWPIHIHVTLTTNVPWVGFTPQKGIPAAGARFNDVPVRINQLITGGVFERFPQLDVVFAEVDCGWVPYYREQLDDRYKRLHHLSNVHLKKMPSDYFKTIYFTYVTDRYGIKNRHEIGIDNILWSSDYPHLGADWPNSWKTIEEHFAGVPDEEQHQILAGNAMRLYHLGD